MNGDNRTAAAKSTKTAREDNGIYNNNDDENTRITAIKTATIKTTTKMTIITKGNIILCN